MDVYDAGLLNDYGGGNVDWWHDYIRSELGAAHDHYQSRCDDLTADLDDRVSDLEMQNANLRDALHLGVEAIARARAEMGTGMGTVERIMRQALAPQEGE
jgi:hypothetical protein